MKNIIPKISNVFNISVLILIGLNFFLKSSVISWITTCLIPFQLGLIVYQLSNIIKEHKESKRHDKLMKFMMETKFKKGDTIYINPSMELLLRYFSFEEDVKIVYDKSVKNFKLETLTEKRKKRINDLS